MDKGVVFIAFTNVTKHTHLSKDHYIKEATHSAKSIKRQHPELHITLFSDTELVPDCFDAVIKISTKQTRVKQHFLEKSPYEKTLYLDSDTEIVGSIVDLFDILDRFDIAATHDMMRKDPKKAKVWKKYADIPDGFSEFAGGVILFKKSEEIRNFFAGWRLNYREWCEVSGKKNDQPSFRVTLWEKDYLKVYVLPPEYNIRFKNYDNITDRIYHRHGLYEKR